MHPPSRDGPESHARIVFWRERPVLEVAPKKAHWFHHRIVLSFIGGESAGAVCIFSVNKTNDFIYAINNCYASCLVAESHLFNSREIPRQGSSGDLLSSICFYLPPTTARKCMPPPFLCIYQLFHKGSVHIHINGYLE